jgi:phosphatidylglycerol:prolipoprotein diacylglycerol transferase
VHPRLLQFGAVAIPTSGVLAAIAILAALFTARAIAKWLSLNPEKVWDMNIAGILIALFVPRLLLIFANWSDFRAHPLWMIGIVHVRSPLAIAGGMVIAILVMGLFAFFTGLPIRPTMDALAPALALGYSIAGLGNFAAGSNFGTPTGVPWAVVYTSRLASIWSGAPLGTPLHPVQIYEALIELCIFALLLAMIAMRKQWKLRGGEIMGAWLFLHGLGSFFLTFLRGDLVTATTNGLFLSETIATIMVVAGGLLWLP